MHIQPDRSHHTLPPLAEHNRENKWANDTDGFALEAQPGQSQERPLKSRARSPSRKNALPNMRSPKTPVPVARA
jgi:hypothetical protein